MKKIYWLFIAFICLIPSTIFAKETYIDKYYIDITLNNNGDALVKEFFVYKGSFNGAYKIISYDTETSTTELFIDADKYSPTNIELLAIKDIKVDDDVNFNYMYNEGTLFTRNDNASVGSTGYYSITKGYKEYTYKIFNPGSYKGFYIEYLLKDVVITHSDISEIWLNIFKNNSDYISELEMIVNLPENEDMLKAWAHGPLTGNIDIINTKKVSFKVNDLYSSDKLDIRLAFDNNLNTIKKSDIEALDKIIEYETVLAEKANQEREEAREYLRKYEEWQKNKAVIFNILALLWIAGLLILVKYIYKNYDKEYISEFKGKYFRDIPNDNDPGVVGYLLDKRVNTKDLSATILNLVYKKNIEFVESGKKDYKFTLINDANTNEIEKTVIRLLFNKKEETTLSEFKKRADKSYSAFLNDYNNWHRKVSDEAAANNYFEKKLLIKFWSILYSLFGFSLFVLCNTYANKIVIVSLFLLAFISLIYFILYTKRTKEGNEEYLKWIGLKNFMIDFGRMDEKELPEVILWEKYLVYAVTLGCASKLAKTMKIKIKEMNNVNSDIVNTSLFNDRLIMMTVMNSIVTTSVNSAVSTAKSVAASQNSSGGGSGGGFSSGGGGFSGGGGGSTGHF